MVSSERIHISGGCHASEHWGDLGGIFLVLSENFCTPKSHGSRKKPGPWMAEPGHMFESVGSRWFSHSHSTSPRENWAQKWIHHDTSIPKPVRLAGSVHSYRQWLYAIQHTYRYAHTAILDFIWHVMTERLLSIYNIFVTFWAIDTFFLNQKWLKADVEQRLPRRYLVQFSSKLIQMYYHVVILYPTSNSISVAKLAQTSSKIGG